MNEIIFELDLFLSNPDNLVTLAYVCVGAFLCLVATGMTNTIIIYRDVADFVWSLAIVLVPLGTLVALGMLAPEETEKAQNLFWQTGQQRLISSVGGLAMVIAVLKTLMNCVSNNGVVLGLVVFAFKVVAAVISVLVCLGVYNNLTEKKPIGEKCSCRGYHIRCFRVLCEQIDKRRQSFEKTGRQRRIVVTAGGLRRSLFVVH